MKFLSLKSVFFLMTSFIALPNLAWGALDIDDIKSRLMAHDDFKISGWVKSKKNQDWVAITALKNSFITVGAKKTNLTVPFINPSQKKAAKKLCTNFGIQMLTNPTSKELDLINETIRVSTTHHKIKLATFSDNKLFVHPKLVGMRVSLHCYSKPRN